MPETVKIKVSIQLRPEDIVSSKEVEVLQLADCGELSCPRCGEPLYGDKLIQDRLYEGVVLVCMAGCGFREY